VREEGEGVHKKARKNNLKMIRTKMAFEPLG
jgi:hypothetical protein